MSEYHKINGIFKRDRKTNKFIIGDYAQEEFKELENNLWEFTEKVDGTNTRVYWDADNKKIEFKGRTDNSQFQGSLYSKLQELFTVEKLEAIFPDTDVTLYGEGYGHKIQFSKNYYLEDEDVSFILFDVRIGHVYLKRVDVQDVALNLLIKSVPILRVGTLLEALQVTSDLEWKSYICNKEPEGVVGVPVGYFLDRMGKRIITKLKHVDFRSELK